MESETVLWINVIIQAIEDYVSEDEDDESSTNKGQAEAWFRSNSADYQTVCTLAEIESQLLRKLVITSDRTKLRKIINEYRETVRQIACREAMSTST